MKAIIIAAGRGSRMKELSDDIPKCLLELNGRRLLDIQLEAIRTNGIKDISIVVGYKKEKIDYPGLKHYENKRYEYNNILYSLFCAEKEMDSEFIAVYSDIIFGHDTIKRLLEDTHDISIVVDTDWRGYYESRSDHPIEEAENVIFDENGYVAKIGKIVPDKEAVNGEFIGMMKCTKKGALIFKSHFRKIRKTYKGKPFQKADVFENAYLTDMIQDLTDSSIKVYCVNISRGWREIDTVGDYQKALREM